MPRTLGVGAQNLRGSSPSPDFSRVAESVLKRASRSPAAGRRLPCTNKRQLKWSERRTGAPPDLVMCPAMVSGRPRPGTRCRPWGNLWVQPRLRCNPLKRLTRRRTPFPPASASSACGPLVFIVLPASREDGIGDKRRRRLPALPNPVKRSQEFSDESARACHSGVAWQVLVASALLRVSRLRIRGGRASGWTSTPDHEHCSPRANGYPRLAHHRPIQSVYWHCPER
jgi:hypothetical protein